MEQVNAEIEQRRRDEREAIRLLDGVPWIGQRATEIIVVEIGADLRPLPSARHLAPRAGLCPGNGESGGKRLSGKTSKGKPWLCQVLIEVALVALGHTILTIIYHLLTRRQPDQDLGPPYFDQPDRQHLERRLVRWLQRCGDMVSLQPAPSSPRAA